MPLGRFQSLALLVFLFVLFLSTGCATPYKTPVLDPADSQFEGISTLLGRHASVDVVSVHGMCTHNNEWVLKTTSRIDAQFSELQLFETKKSTVEKIDIYETTFVNADGDVRLKNYALVWSALTKDAKHHLCYDSSMQTPSCQTQAELNQRSRASINAALKSTLINDCFSDAIIYLGTDGDVMRNAFRASMDTIVASSTSEGPVVLVSESLGSKVLADALIEDVAGKSARLAYFAPTEIVFMAANQIPLLELTEADANKDGQPDSAWVEFLREIVGNKFDERGVLSQVIAFTDPNDLLSYELRNRPFSVANVLVSNDKTWFGTLERPDTAHRGYLDNEKVWDFILCGHSAVCPTGD